MTDDSDQFEPFRRLFEQSQSGQMPGLGWPLSPVPLPGGTGADPPSPEVATKRTIKQLYSALAAFSDSDATGATDFWTRYLDAFDLDGTAFGPEQVSAATVRTYRIWFFSLTQMLVESYTLRLVQDRLVVEEHRNATRTQEWLWGLPQSDREQLLQRCTDVSDDLVGEMRTLRRRRDELLYTFGGSEDVDADRSAEDARRALDVLTALDDLVTEGSPFSYAPAESADEESVGDEKTDESA